MHTATTRKAHDIRIDESISIHGISSYDSCEENKAKYDMKAIYLYNNFYSTLDAI